MAIEDVKQYFAQYGMSERIQELAASSATVELAAASSVVPPHGLQKPFPSLWRSSLF